jgi:steroid 5-alpha reductase family enzyme
MLLIGLIVILIFMSMTWLASLYLRNAGIVDVAWSFGFSISAALYLTLARAITLRQWLIAGMVVLWSLRLTWHLFVRFLKLHPVEDSRYKALRLQLGEHSDAKMYLIFLFQGLVLTALTAPLAVSVADPSSQLSWPHYAGLFVWSLAFVGVSLADYQLSQFIGEPGNKGRTCQIGLWRYSRHPNYFFEWLGALAYWLFALGSPCGIWTIASPLLLLHLLLNVTGVKPAEEQSLRSKTDYPDYQKSTSAFVPWPRRRPS